MTTPLELSKMEALCFPDATSTWSERDYAAHMDSAAGIAMATEAGFVVGTVAADEAEIITIGVLPEERRKGCATKLLDKFEQEVKGRGAAKVFLEVAVDNLGAMELYKSGGYIRVGRRREYYENAEGISIDANILKKTL